MFTRKAVLITYLMAFCLIACSMRDAWSSSLQVVGPITISFQSNGTGEFDYYDNGASGNYIQTSPVTIPAQITAVSPSGLWNALLPDSSPPADINFGLSGNGQFNAATVNGNTFSQILNIQWGADFSNNAGVLSIIGTTPLTINGSLNGTNATIQGSFSQLSVYQSGMPTDFAISQPELLTINLNTTGLLTLDSLGMLNSFTGDWGGGLAPQTAVPEPSDAMAFLCGLFVLTAFLGIECMKYRKVNTI